MKRFSMAMTWLALAGLMTTVSCRKPVVGFTNGEARTVTISAVTESGNGSKTAIDGLNVNWSVGDQIRMNAESVLTLKEGAGTTEGVFEGPVTGDGPYRIGYPADATTYSGTTLKLSILAEWTYDTEKQIVPMVAVTNSVEGGLQFHNAVNMLKMQLKGDGTAASKLKSIVLTSTTSNLNGKINVTFNGETPEFAAIADGDGVSKTMTVNFGEEGLQLTTDATTDVYIPLAKINGGDLTVRFNCANGKHMERKVTVTEKFNAVNNMLSAPELTVDTKPKFSVSAETKVEFAPGNLYWDGTESKFKFEANQWSTTPASSGTWDANHVSHFFWSKTATVTYAGSYKDNDASTDDVFFTEAEGFHVGNETGWRTLSKAEWSYLIGESIPGRSASLRKWSAVTFGESGPTVNGLIIMPDGWEGTLTATTDYTTWQSLESSGAVFLPAAGFRSGTGMNSVGSYGDYWSSSPSESGKGSAHGMSFHSGNVGSYVGGDRSYGFAVRLVR